MVCGSPMRNSLLVVVVFFVRVVYSTGSTGPGVETKDIYYEVYPVHDPLATPSHGGSTILLDESGNQTAVDTRFQQNCTDPTIQDFPPDMFTQEQRQQGAVVVHFIICIYAMLMIGIVVDEYFVPSLEIIAEVLHMSPDVAGATIMAIGTSSPELFINIVGTFITQGDIGVGMIVGSAAFNILAVPACCGLFTGFAVALDWWPLTRDCLIYGSIVIGLTVVVADGMIFWWEAMIFVLCYGVFLTVMYFNGHFEKAATYLVAKVRGACCTPREDDEDHDDAAHSDSVGNVSNDCSVKLNGTKEANELQEISTRDGGAESPEPREAPTVAISEPDGPVELFKWPEGNVASKIYWYVMWLGNLIFVLTIPDVRRKGWRRTYPLAFFICILWIGSLTYLVTWFITVIGYTLGIPDSAMGITFLAAGGSVPEAVAAVVVARAGKGSMGISNSVGSNTFDVLICMGLPWLIKAAAMPEYPTEGNFVAISSGGVVYSVLMLFCTVLILYFAIAFNKFVLDRKIGVVLLLSYMTFLVLAGMFEMNVFMQVNAPPCSTL